MNFSSDAHVVRGQNLVKNNPLKISNKNYDTINDDNAGEVIQERFNPKPWFAYETSDAKGPTYIPPAKPSNNNQPDYAVPSFDSFPLAVKPSETDKPSPAKPPFESTDKTIIDMDTGGDSYPDTPQIDDTGINGPPLNTYGSPYNSYYPASEKPPTNLLKKPNNYVTRPYDDYLPPEMGKPPKETQIPEHPEHDNMENSMADHPKHVDSHYFDHGPPAYSSSFHDDHDDKPPKDTSSDSYDSHDQPPYSSFHDDHDAKPPKDDPSDSYDPHDHPDHSLSFHYDHDDKPPKDAPSDSYGSHDFPGLPSYIEHDPHVHGYSFDPHQYPYDHHPHIYHEVKTTTTEAPERERLSKRPYSYYYLGRKLWYIPLYFSVYFIIYIFVLILKSIARHKITFNHYFEDDKREMKDMHVEHEEHVHELEDYVGKEINNARRKYVM